MYLSLIRSSPPYRYSSTMFHFLIPILLPFLPATIFDTTPHRTKSARRTSRPSTARRRTHRRRQLLRCVVAGGGTALRSLCWLLLHRRCDVSEGAAAVLLALTNLAPAAGAAGAIGSRPAPPWVVLGLVEQGCVPILRMAAGRLAAASANPSPKVDGEGGGAVEAPPAAGAAAAAQVAVDRDAEADAGVDSGGGEGGCGSVARVAARVVLEAVADEACVRHVDRLVHSVSVSGNRELRANVALAIGILSAGTERGEGGGGKVVHSAALACACAFSVEASYHFDQK